MARKNITTKKVMVRRIINLMDEVRRLEELLKQQQELLTSNKNEVTK